MTYYEKSDGLQSAIASLPLPVAAEQQQRRQHRRVRLLIAGSIAYLLCLVLSCLPSESWSIVPFSHKHEDEGKVNIILMISDGYGPASETFGRSFHQALHNDTSPDAKYKSPLDNILIGSHRSRSSDSLITDSAAGATAFSCALKSYNGAIGVDAKGKLCGTVLEGAKEQGLLTGVVVTSRLSDATPASFFAHVPSRAQEADIANEALGLLKNGTSYRAAPLDLAVGGGGCYFLPRSSPYSCRGDEQDLVGLSIEKGWNTRVFFQTNQTELDAAQVADVGVSHYQGENAHLRSGATTKSAELSAFFDEEKDVDLPLLALLAPFNTPYEIDRPASSPNLRKIALKAIDALDRSPSNKKGFFIMIEGSQIDLCAHSNDPACHAREIEAYQEAIDGVTQWVNKRNAHPKHNRDSTLMISTSDHETGGLSLAKQLTSAYPNYAYYPERLIRVKQSAASLSARLIAFARTSPIPPTKKDVEQYVRHDILGASGAAFLADNGGEPSQGEVDAVVACLPLTPSPPPGPPSEKSSLSPTPPINTADVCRTVIADLVSRRAEVGWSTSGHSAVDVPVHAVGHALFRLLGNIENTDIGAFIAFRLGVDLAALTRRLSKERPKEG